MRLTIFHNESAGGGNDGGDELARVFRDAGHAVELHGADDGDMKPEALEDADAVAIAGGDGTVARVIRAFGGRIGRPVTVVPLGTANNIATSLGISGSAQAVAAGLRTPTRRRLDLGLAEGPWGATLFMEGVGMGPLAAALAAGKQRKDLSGDEKTRFGRRKLQDVLRKADARRWSVTLDGAPYAEDLVLIEVMNLPQTGPELPIAPDADPGDGRLDLAYLRPDGLPDLLAWLEDGAADAPPAIETVQAFEVAFRWTDEPLRVDDDYPDPPGRATQVRLRLAEAGVDVLVPGGAR